MKISNAPLGSWRHRFASALLCLALVPLSTGGPAAAQEGEILRPPPSAGPQFVVTSTGDEPDFDSFDGVCNVLASTRFPRCTLRAAIEEGNFLSQPVAITFNIAGTGVPLLRPATPLPTVTGALRIDGSTQPGAGRIELDGRLLSGQGTRALLFQSQGALLRGFAIHGFPLDAVEIRGGGGNTVAGNLFGLQGNGRIIDSNLGASVLILDSPGNVVGGPAVADRNVFAGGNPDRNNIEDSALVIRGPASTGNQVYNNHFGIDAAGVTALALAGPGVYVFNAPGNAIGVGSQGNVFAGAGTLDPTLYFNGFGLILNGPQTQSTTVVANRFGTNPAGTLAFPNLTGGIAIINGASLSQIGNGTAAGMNLISASPVGILLGFPSDTPVSPNETMGNLLIGNRIGTTADGLAALGNGVGIQVGSATSATQIGGVISGEGNLISGNTEANILFEGLGSAGNFVRGNLIGPDATGNRALLNGGIAPIGSTVAGIRLGSGAVGNTIGGAGPGARNVISGNAGDGILLDGRNLGNGILTNQIQGNLIGLNLAGNAVLPNSGNGIRILDASANTIGGGAPGAGNVISGNRLSGILISGAFSDNNWILGNRIGSNAAGTVPFPNGSQLANSCRDGYGVHVVRSVGSMIGGTGAGEGNLIAFNRRAGILVENSNPCVESPNGVTNAKVQLRRNLLFDNGGLGIDLAPVGVNGNDIGDGDSGPNQLQNAPVGQQLTVPGSLFTVNTTLSTDFTIDFFASPTCDPSGFGEGANLVGTRTFNSGSTGNFGFGLTPFGLPGAPFITATLTNNSDGVTSEFSNCVNETGGLSLIAGALNPFLFTQGGSLPPAQALTVSVSDGSNRTVTASDDRPWITVAPASALAPASFTVTVDPSNLPVGDSTGTITLSASGIPSQTVTVVARVSASQGTAVLVVQPPALSFTATAGGANPANQQLSISSSNGTPLPFTITDNATFLAVTPSSGTTPATGNVSVDIANLAAGTYGATISVASPGLATVAVPVIVTVGSGGGGGGGGTVLQNGGFEAGTAPWIFTAEALLASGDGLARSGVNSALLAPTGLTSSVFQEIAVPCSGAPALSFFLNVNSAITQSLMVDRLFVEITSPTGAIQQILGTFSNLDRVSGATYTQRGPYSLSGFACQTVRLRFRAVPGTGALGGSTDFRVDDVAIQ